MTEKILIDGHQFTAITSINLTKEATLCKHPVEDQTEISDHVVLNPVVFEYEIQLFNAYSEHVVTTNAVSGQTESEDALVDEYDTLDTLYKNKKPFTLDTHRGQYDNMILTKLSDAKATSANTTMATITIEQVRTGTSETIKNGTTTKTTATLADTIDEITPFSEEDYPGWSILQNPTKVETNLTTNWDETQSAKANLQIIGAQQDGFERARENASNVSSLIPRS
jgi:hypothetical protein